MRFLLVGLAVLAPAVARAGEQPPSVRVTATATSSLDKFPPYAAVDGSPQSSTGWCANKGDGTGEALTLTFDAPVAIANADIAVGLAGDVSAPSKLEVKTSSKTVVVDTPGGGYVRVALGGTTTSVAIKILAVKPGKRMQTCISGVRLMAPNTYYYGFIYGFERAAIDAFPAIATQLDTALRHCDEKALEAIVKFPLVHTHSYDGMQGMDVPAPKKRTYRTLGELVTACRRDDNPLSSGFAGWSEDVDLAKDVAHASTPKLGMLEIGSESSSAWTFVLAGTRWQLTSMFSAESVMNTPKEAITELVKQQIEALAKQDASALADAFTPDAKLAVVEDEYGLLAPSDAALRIPGLERNKKHVEKDVTVQLSRDHKSAVLAFTTKLLGPVLYGELRVSEVVVHSDGWHVAGGMWSEPWPNADVNKAALAHSSKMKAVWPVDRKGDDSLERAFLALQAGPLDPIAAARKDLIAFGSGPGERTVGGAVLAKPWAVAWAKHWQLASGVEAIVAPSGTMGWVLADIRLDKPKPSGGGTYTTTFRVMFVFERTFDGGWTLVHAHFAVPMPV